MDGINWYAYAGNDPINRTDPTGLDDEPEKPAEVVVVKTKDNSTEQTEPARDPGVVAQEKYDKELKDLMEGPPPPPRTKFEEEMSAATNAALRMMDDVEDANSAFTEGNWEKYNEKMDSANKNDKWYNQHLYKLKEGTIALPKTTSPVPARPATPVIDVQLEQPDLKL
jgi:uncharacterized protein RhaS with RHS repeats